MSEERKPAAAVDLMSRTLVVNLDGVIPDGAIQVALMSAQHSIAAKYKEEYDAFYEEALQKQLDQGAAMLEAYENGETLPFAIEINSGISF